MSDDVKVVGDAVIAAVKGYVGKVNDGLAVRIDATDRTVNAMQTKLATLEAALQALPDTAKQAAVLDSLERRASRHAEHLGTLESRVQTLEHSPAGKGKK